MSFKGDVQKRDELDRQIRNLKSTIRRRMKKIEKMFDPLERGRLEDEVKRLRVDLKKLEHESLEIDAPYIERVLSVVDPQTAPIGARLERRDGEKTS